MELCLVDFSVESVYYLDAPDVWGGNGLLQIGKFTGAIPAMRISELWIRFSAN